MADKFLVSKQAIIDTSESHWCLSSSDLEIDLSTIAATHPTDGFPTSSIAVYENSFVSGSTDLKKYIRSDKPWMHAIPGYTDKAGYGITYSDCVSYFKYCGSTSYDRRIPSGTYFIKNGKWYTDSAKTVLASSTLGFEPGAVVLLALTSGGGGSSGSSGTVSGAGGGGSATAVFIVDCTQATQINISIGAGGAGGNGNTSTTANRSGSDGEISSVTVYDKYGKYVSIQPENGYGGEQYGSSYSDSSLKGETKGGKCGEEVYVSRSGYSSDETVISGAITGSNTTYIAYWTAASSTQPSTPLVYLLRVIDGGDGNENSASSDTTPLVSATLYLTTKQTGSLQTATARKYTGIQGSGTGGSGGYSALGYGGNGESSSTSATAGVYGGGGGAPKYVVLQGANGTKGGDGVCVCLHCDGTTVMHNL